MADTELERALQGMREAYGDEARWADPTFVIELADKIERSLDDEEVVKLLSELAEFVDKRQRRILLAATVIRALAVIGRIAKVVLV